jgi:hypothetical protein
MEKPDILSTDYVFGHGTFFDEDVFSYNDILSSSVVKTEGILFNDERFSFESYWENGFNHYERLFYINESDEKAPFSGLLYELYPDGSIHGYSFYKDGYEEGQNVDFYDNGVISKYIYYDKISSETLVIKCFKNGNIEEMTELVKGIRRKYIKYDEDGNIVKHSEVLNADE